MKDRELYARILGISSPWRVTEVVLIESERRLEVRVEHSGSSALSCPECGDGGARHDSRPRRWRHLDTCQYKTILVAKVPRVRCAEHGVRQVRVPWSEPGSRFTALFESLVIDWLREASSSAVARCMKLSWDQVDGIMARAVRRGLARRSIKKLRRLGVDEVSAKRRHRYLTIVSDHDTDRVVHVSIGRKKSALGSFFARLTTPQRRAISVVTMDMWEAYITATKAWVPGAERKIAFDKFHVAKSLGDAVDKVRRAENKQLLAEGDRRLVGSKWLWLRNMTTLREEAATRFESLRSQALKVARAWSHKEIAMGLWWRRDRNDIEKEWERWCRGAARSRLTPIIKVASMIKRHLQGIINAVEQQLSNGRAEGINSRIQWVKRMARGYRNTQRFVNAIYFHLGGLDVSHNL
jgi:transposase